MTGDKYERLAQRAERGELTLEPGTVRRGAAAGAVARDATHFGSYRFDLDLRTNSGPSSANVSEST